MTEITFQTFDDAMREGRVEACSLFLASIPEAERQDFEYIRALLWFHYRQSQFEQTVAVHRELLRLQPTDYNYRHVLFDCCSHLGWVDRAREVVDAMAATAGELFTTLFQAEMLYVMGLDDEAAAISSPFERSDLYSTIAQMTLGQAKMRSLGVPGNVEAYSRAYTDRRARELIYGNEDGWPLDEYWYGQNPLPRRLILRGFGGVGDTFQWLRYVSFLNSVGVELVGLDGRTGGIALKPWDDDVERDWARVRMARWDGPLVDATYWTTPFALFTGLFPALGYAASSRGYLKTEPDPSAEDQLRAIRAKADGRPCLAVTWSSAESPHFAARSLTFDQMKPLFAMDEVHWVVCQRGLNRQIFLESEYAATATVLPTSYSFNQTGVILEGLDAVVSNDGSLVQLGGGLGCKTFLLASAVTDWRWGIFPGSSPWYSQICLVRQPVLGDWDGAVDGLRAALNVWASARQSRGGR